MRLIDIAIPRSDTDAPESTSQPHTRPTSQSGGYQLADGPHDFDDGASFLTDATDLRRGDDDGDFHDAIDDTSEVSASLQGDQGRLLISRLTISEPKLAVQTKDLRTRVRRWRAEGFAFQIGAECRRPPIGDSCSEWLCARPGDTTV
jgi:hypothetical protein